MEGTPFGRYRLLSLLGQGGMGEVWRAFDTDTNRVVAVKLLPANLAHDPQFEQRFRREANAAAGLNDPHVVPIHHFGEIDGRLYVDMRFIEGRDLHRLIADGPMHPSRAVAIIDHVASALDAAHRIGLMHRDVKPSNILIGERDFAYLIDFGIARAANDTSMTSTGAVIGTWAYLAPERITGKPDHRADIYALTCVLHECLTGQQPFPGTSIEQQIGSHLGLPPPRPSAVRDTVPIQFDAVIAKGMAKNPDDRYATVGELASAAKSAVTAPLPRSPVPPPPYDCGFNTDPTRQRPAPPGPHQPGPKPSRKGLLLGLAAAAVVALVIIVTVIALPDSGGGSSTATSSPTTSPSTSTTPTALPNTGPFTGTFSAAFGPQLKLDGTPSNGAPPGFTDTFDLRSACGTNGCVATASTGGQYASKDVVFDEVGGQWLAVSTTRTTCRDVEGDEAWNVIALQAQPDGTMTGEMTQSTAGNCRRKRTVTFRRTGDTDIARLPDPADLPPRAVSPAQALHGSYDDVESAANGLANRYHLGVRTDCLRTADRCVTNFVDPDGAGETFIFATGTWTRDATFDVDCSTGGTNTTKITGMLSLPQPPQDPITQLTGHGYKEVIASQNSTCHSQAYDVTMTRVGD
jgi:serine/threonine protein kinase